MNIQLRRKLDETCEYCQINEVEIERYIELKWIHPVDSENLFFDEEDTARIMLVRDLEEKFGVNSEGIDLILHLIDHINRLHLEIKKGD